MDYFNNFQEFIYTRTYARYLDTEKRRENWNETVDRYKNYFQDRLKDENLLNELETATSMIKSLKIVPSMRLLWSAGKAVDVENISAYNCAAICIDNIYAFSEILYILMCGTGTGYSVEKEYIDKLPSIPNKFTLSSDTIIFEDSRCGWADGYNKFIQGLFNGVKYKIDTTKIRKKGERLKTFGGRAAGSECLIDLLEKTYNIIYNAKGRKLKSIECYDICCHIASIVVVSGVRRSACICLTDLKDKDMQNAKNGDFSKYNIQRYMSNNSVAYENKPSKKDFINEWENLKNSGSGERGIFNREAVLSQMLNDTKRDLNVKYITNPCLSFDCNVISKNGMVKVGDINKGDFIWSIDGWAKVIDIFKREPINIYKYKTTAGYFKGTKNHKVISNSKKIQVERAKSIDICVGYKSNFIQKYDCQAIVDGLVMGDGTIHKANNNLLLLCIGKKDQDYFDSEIKSYIGYHYDKEYSYRIKTTIKKTELLKTYDRVIPDRFFYGNRNILCSFLRGLYSANGSVLNVGRISLKATSLYLIEQTQQMLSSIGIRSYYTTNKAKKVKFNNGEYKCKQSYDLCINSDRDIFYSKIGFLQKYKMEKLKPFLKISKSNCSKKTFDIFERQFIKKDIVYDILVDNESHSFWCNGLNVSNCGETILRDTGQFCNLSEVIIRHTDTLKTLKKKVRYATFIGCIQATLTDFNFIRKQWKENTERERLLGVSLTGLRDHPVLQNISDTSKKWLKLMKAEAIKYAKIYSDMLGINNPKAVTLIKPSGTVSLLVNVSSGLHPRFSEYYIRRVTVSSVDPVSKLLLHYKVPHKKVISKNATNYIFEFPLKSPPNSVSNECVDARQQLDYYLMLKKYWCQQNASTTIFIKENEWESIGDYVYENWNDIIGVAFLPDNNGNYENAPYEAIDKKTYEKLCKGMKKIDFSMLKQFEIEDFTQGSHTLACIGNKCEI